MPTQERHVRAAQNVRIVSLLLGLWLCGFGGISFPIALFTGLELLITAAGHLIVGGLLIDWGHAPNDHHPGRIHWLFRPQCLLIAGIGGAIVAIPFQQENLPALLYLGLILGFVVLLAFESNNWLKTLPVYLPGDEAPDAIGWPRPD